MKLTIVKSWYSTVSHDYQVFPYVYHRGEANKNQPHGIPSLARRLDGGHIVAFLHQGTATEVVALPIEANRDGFLDVNIWVIFQKYDAEWDISISLIYIYIYLFIAIDASNIHHISKYKTYTNSII